MTKSFILAIAAVLIAVHAAPALAKPIHRGASHSLHRAHFHHHLTAHSARAAFGAVLVPRHFGADPNSPAATGGGSLGYNRGIYAN